MARPSEQRRRYERRKKDLRALRESFGYPVMDRILDRFMFDEGRLMKKEAIHYTPFKELSELNGWEMGWLRKRVRESGGKVIVLIHPGHLSLDVYGQVLSPKLFRKIKPVHEKYMKTLGRLLENRKAPLVVMEEDDCVGHTSIDLEDVFGLDPRRNKDVYFIRTLNKLPTPITGWNGFHGLLQEAGVEKALVGGQILTVTDSKTKLDKLEEDFKEDARTTQGDFEGEIRLSKEAKKRALEASHELEQRMLEKVADEDKRERIRRGMRAKRRSLGRDRHMRKCVGALANNLQARGIPVRVMPMVTSPERPPRKRRKSRPQTENSRAGPDLHGVQSCTDPRLRRVE